MSQLVTQTTTYGLNSDQYSISTLSSVGGVLEIMAGNPHNETTAPTPIADFKSDQSVKFYGIADLSNGVTLPEKVIGTKLLADKSVTSAKIADNVTIVGNLTGTASKATADASGNVITDTYAPKASPTFTGTVTVPTPSTSDNSTLCASTAYVKNNLANYLPLSGGTMNGTITFKTLHVIRRDIDDSYITILSGTDANGSYLQLFGKNFSENTGGFVLKAKSSDGDNSLFGLPDGTLTWGGKEVDRINSMGTSFVRYESGLQICVGYFLTSTSEGVSVTFPVPFVNVPYLVCWTNNANPKGVGCDIRSTGLSDARSFNVSGVQGKEAVRYFAFGQWK